MGLFDRISRVVRSNLNDMVSKAEDPEKILEQTVIEMQEDLVQLRQAVAQAIASQKRSQQQYNQSQSQANQWLSRAQLALQKGDENLAREALQRKKSYEEQANTIKATLDGQTTQVEALKRNLIQLESKISEAKTKKNMLKARAQAAKANEQLQGMLGGINTSGGMAAFDRMEEKVLQMEARSNAAGELAGADLESQFKALEAGNVDDDLAALKAQMQLGPAQTQAQLPPSQASTPQTPAQKTEVDAELEQLRKELDNL
ncbi:PspA/IM30 family protein [Limnoraphis robusta]|uniref:PspA/IM30 family protein n=1 Tax=Limnoraphis robusta TaxID=1118279 RepID=UPI002B20F76D|nr:PspA/IM30 family protein [Limnoraphis robusta]MEA5497599.1 PspA/IM30 family protein [Limnoraphis robusta BA-68 BA1]